ncbi:hypothetical protein LCGC14_2442210 [marine sediment metagenome]|uniref:Uncharacterized protein n=1 Tax=marine sediment metagenome TaxID=412755 RepID=A0A0F9ECN9_9ZZZZ
MSKHVEMEPATVYRPRHGKQRYFTKDAAYREAAKAIVRNEGNDDHDPDYHERITKLATKLQAEDEQ